jgi:hypothetical protein
MITDIDNYIKELNTVMTLYRQRYKGLLPLSVVQYIVTVDGFKPTATSCQQLMKTLSTDITDVSKKESLSLINEIAVDKFEKIFIVPPQFSSKGKSRLIHKGRIDHGILKLPLLKAAGEKATLYFPPLGVLLVAPREKQCLKSQSNVSIKNQEFLEMLYSIGGLQSLKICECGCGALRVNESCNTSQDVSYEYRSYYWYRHMYCNWSTIGITLINKTDESSVTFVRHFYLQCSNRINGVFCSSCNKIEEIYNNRFMVRVDHDYYKVENDNMYCYRNYDRNFAKQIGVFVCNCGCLFTTVRELVYHYVNDYQKDECGTTFCIDTYKNTKSFYESLVTKRSIRAEKLNAIWEKVVNKTSEIVTAFTVNGLQELWYIYNYYSITIANK